MSEFNAKLDIADPGERAKRRKEAQDVVAPAVDLIERVLIKQMAAVLEQMRELQKHRTQRGARLQILREVLTAAEWERVCRARPGIKDWFDADGVPRQRHRRRPGVSTEVHPKVHPGPETKEKGATEIM